MYLISYGCSVSIKTSSAFRIAWGVQAVPGLILFIALFFFPESPRWLASKDKWEEAHEILANLHASGDMSNPTVIAELEEVREAVRIAAESSHIGYLGLFAPGIWKRTLVGVSVQIWQQLLGGNIMLYYLVYIFEMSGLVCIFVSFHLEVEFTDKVPAWQCGPYIIYYSICYFPSHHGRNLASH